ncbi:hypothetical protein PFISCL1PPCAC_12371, partial [Pristionchus fissidentatus]
SRRMILRTVVRVLSRQRRLRYLPRYRSGFSPNTVTLREFSKAAASNYSKPTEYRKLSSVEHILLRPDTYIGSTMETEEEVWLVEGDRFTRRRASFCPGLLKIVDEILVNAADNKQRDERMTEIRVTIDESTGEISVWNDGRGLPIEKIYEDGEFIPSLVFGSLYTSSNYDDEQARIVGGRNGFGAKLANIYSTRFHVETASADSGLVFEQVCSLISAFQNNLSLIFSDLARQYVQSRRTRDLHSDTQSSAGLRADTVALLHRRVYDLAATLKGVEISLNGRCITVGRLTEIKDQKEEGDGEIAEIFYHYPTHRWEVAMGIRTGKEEDDGGIHDCVSFVNNCATAKGGKHVSHVWERCIGVLRPWLEKKIERSVRPAQIKRRLVLFVNALIDNPTFDSQLKETLLTNVADFGSDYSVDTKGLLAWAERVSLDELIREDLTEGKRSTSSRRAAPALMFVEKLEDAALAGGKRSEECSLILTEGDSAKALAVSGLQVVGRERFGVYPLRGKLTNVSGLERSKALAVPEVAALMTILCLRPGVDYSNPVERARLRYGRVILLTDQDEDGSHIKGLVMNIFRCLWPALLQYPFLTALDTPLIKASKGATTVSFYSRQEFEKWSEVTADAEKWKIKYYKGLGTSTAEEAREYFRDMENRLVHFVWTDEEDGDSIDAVFDRTKSAERKRWIEGGHISSTIAEENEESLDKRSMRYSRFVHGELRTFAVQDLKRSIPSVVDGLKPSQRKILHTCLKMGMNKQEKVAQLAARVAHSTAYHHGENSLVAAIVNMAQDFVGASNVPLLKGIGQFGTRHAGGEDAASARYIYAALSPISRLLFPSADDRLLQAVKEEGVEAEPIWYCPILPLVLINGAEGIATGWSTTVRPRDPAKIMDTVRRRIEDDKSDLGEDVLPYYSGFTGSIERQDERRIRCAGRIGVQVKTGKSGRDSRLATVIIDELPVGVWTNNYKKKVIAPLVRDGDIRNIRELHTDDRVRFELELSAETTKKI